MSPGFSPGSRQWQVVALGMMSYGEDRHTQALVLYLVELRFGLVDAHRRQPPQKIVLSLQTNTGQVSIIYAVTLQWYNLQISRNHPKNKQHEI